MPLAFEWKYNTCFTLGNEVGYVPHPPAKIERYKHLMFVYYHLK